MKRQNMQVCFGGVTSSVHDTPAMFTAKPPGMCKTGGFAFVPGQYRFGSVSPGVSNRSVRAGTQHASRLSPRDCHATEGRPVRVGKHTPAGGFVAAEPTCIANEYATTPLC